LLRDPYANHGVQVLRDVAGITDAVVGDGTTTAVIIARELLRRAFDAVTRGCDRIAVCAGIAGGWAKVSDAIGSSAEPLRGTEDLIAVASNAARDRCIGTLVADALQRTGHDGVVNVQDDRAYGVRLEFTDGMTFPSGLLAPELATDATRGTKISNSPTVAAYPSSM
jgi:chaperonin GroEL